MVLTGNKRHDVHSYIETEHLRVGESKVYPSSNSIQRTSAIVIEWIGHKKSRLAFTTTRCSQKG